MTLFLRQLGNVLVITPKTASLPKHSALRLCISHLSPDQSENKERKQNQEATLNTRVTQLSERCSLKDAAAEFYQVENDAEIKIMLRKGRTKPCCVEKGLDY